MQLAPQIGKREARKGPCLLHVKLIVLTKGAPDQVLGPGAQRALFFVGQVGQISDIQRYRQGVPGFRHGKTLHIVAVAMMALRGDVVVDRLDKRIGRDARIQQQISVRRSRPAWCLMLKENTVNTQPGHAGNHGAVNRIRVIVAHQVKLVAAAFAQLVVAFLISTRHRQPVGFVHGMADAIHRHRQDAVIPRRQVKRAAGGRGLYRDQRAGHTGRQGKICRGGQLVHGAVNPFRLDKRTRLDRHHGPGVSLVKSDHALRRRGGFCRDVHRPRQQAQHLPGCRGHKHIGQHRADQHILKPQHRRGHNRGDKPPER
ncbi:hypothetical protein HOS07_gp11 [Cronobacter phage ESSI-2]|uniref:Uncharacterized protein n=1 Tax=Cronobacter phage ESSI-2 TaxID=947842 RepID=F1BUK7_9CAUD|nr:hypothetical protein HOS07_gp11 [Cronobacter phage ESSI-2]ADX32375.1 hypothetical protein [Cronobacter phage ESSI-2]